MKRLKKQEPEDSERSIAQAIKAMMSMMAYVIIEKDDSIGNFVEERPAAKKELYEEAYKHVKGTTEEDLYRKVDICDQIILQLWKNLQYSYPRQVGVIQAGLCELCNTKKYEWSDGMGKA